MSITRSRGGWFVSERVPPTRDGRRIRLWVATLFEAAKVLEETAAEAQSRSDSPLFDEIAERFLRDHASTKRSPKTFESSVRMLKRTFSGRTLLDIGPQAIRDFISTRLAEGVRPGTVNRQRACLSSIFTFAIDTGLHIGPHPCLRSTPGRVKPLPEAPPRERFLDGDEAERLLKAVEDDPPIHALIVAALRTGCRKNELLTLRWSDLSDGMLHVRGTVAKSGKHRAVPIDPVLAKTLDHLKRDGDLVFQKLGRPIDREALRAIWDRACKKANLSGVRFHDLRRTFATWFGQRGGSILRLQALLGHSTLEMTRRYARLSLDDLRDATRFFGPPQRPKGATVAKLSAPMPAKRHKTGTPGRLQIRWEPGEPGSGGFDSHTLPPASPLSPGRP